MPVGIAIQIDAREARRKFARLGRELRPGVLTKLIGFDFLHWIDRNFTTEGTEARWKPLKASTIRRRREGPNPSRGVAILQDTGRVKDSFVRGKSGNVFASDDRQVTVGTQVPYGEFHEKGTSRMPRRRLLPSDRLAESIGIKTIRAAITSVARGR